LTFAASGACSNTSGAALITMTSGTGTCSVTATKAADTNYNSTTSAAATVGATLATQATLTVTGMPVTAQAYQATFTVGSSGGSGTGALTFAASGACSNTVRRSADHDDVGHRDVLGDGDQGSGHEL
jgi:trimeric autotransporter adhesin